MGDTVGKEKENNKALEGYAEPNPVVWASIFPEDQNDLVLLKQSLAKLKLTDSSLFMKKNPPVFWARASGAGFGYVAFGNNYGTAQKEFNLNLIITKPSITYEVEYKPACRQAGMDKKINIFRIFSRRWFD